MLVYLCIFLGKSRDLNKKMIQEDKQTMNLSILNQSLNISWPHYV